MNVDGGATLIRSAPFVTRDHGNDGFTLEGYAAVFDTPTRISSWEGTFDEQIAYGAFSRSIKARTPVMQFDHGHDTATGSVPIAAIDELREDRRGLFVRARLFDNARVEPIRQAIAGGALNGMSFRFRVVLDEWKDTSDMPLRTLRQVDLFELGPVVMPAYEATTVGIVDGEKPQRSSTSDGTDPRAVRALAEVLRHGQRAPAPVGAWKPNHDTTSGGSDPLALLSLTKALRNEHRRSA